MDNLAFKIQLGVILPKLEDKISNSTLEIFEELVGFVQAGEVEGADISVEEIKEKLFKDFKIFLDKKIIKKSVKLKKEAHVAADQEAVEIEPE